MKDMKKILLWLLIPCFLGIGIASGFELVGSGGVAVVGASLLVYWDGGDSAGTETQLNTYQEDSGTITTTDVVFTQTGYGGSGHSAYIDDAGGTCNFTCTDGTSIDLNKGTIDFWYKRRGTMDAYGVLFQLGTGANDFVLRFYSDEATNIQFRYNSNRVQYTTEGLGLFPVDTWVHVILDWDNNGAAEVHRLRIGGTFDSSGSFVQGTALGTKPTIGTPTMYLINDNTDTYSANGEIDELRIYDDIN